MQQGRTAMIKGYIYVIAYRIPLNTRPGAYLFYFFSNQQIAPAPIQACVYSARGEFLFYKVY